MRLAMIVMGAVLALPAQAGSPYAGQNKATASCAQCHGLRAPAEASVFPKLSGRDAEYLKNALKHYRDKTRHSEIMNAMAASLSDSDINDIVSFYSNVRP